MRVFTSDLRNADFTGAAFITINGWWGSTSEARLVPLDPATGTPLADVHTFTRTAVAEFEVYAEDVGPFSSISMRMVGHDVFCHLWCCLGNEVVQMC